MGTAHSIKLGLVFVLVMMVPGAMILAEDPPSTRDQEAREDTPAAAVPAPPSAFTLDIPPPPPGSWGIVSEGDGGGGIFRDTDSEAEAWLGSGGFGVWSFGVSGGGHFRDTDNTGYAYVARGAIGIEAIGIETGGYFEDLDGTSRAWVGFGNLGIQAHGLQAGGEFVNLNGTSHASVAYGGWGIEAHGDGAGGYFEDDNGSGKAWVAYGDWGLAAHGNGGGGNFIDTDGTGWASVAIGDRGIEAYGDEAGGYFQDSNGTGKAYVGKSNYGIQAWGHTAAAYFEDLEGGSRTYVAHGDMGVYARGYEAGGYFEDWDASGYAFVGWGDRGIEAHGNEAGGYFGDLDGTGFAKVGHGDVGIEAWGELAGGYFGDTNGTGRGYVGHADWGIEAFGTGGGGYFNDSDGTGRASVGVGDRGIEAHGTDTGGFFNDLNGTAYAHVANGDWGIRAYGNLAGGFFLDINGTGYTKAGSGDRGIEAFGDGAGGHFEDLDEGTYSNVAISTYSIHGNGTKAFVQNHPYDRDAVIVYAAPEGDEVATYTRGTARLADGEATVPLGETFKWVTNPDLGLTVHLTPVGDPCVLYVIDQATDEITVRSDSGNDCTFHYLVYGLRIGFEEMSIVQEKEREAYIPSMADHRQLYQRRPDLMAYNSLERFKGMRRDAGQKDELDLSRAQALHDAVVEFDPAVHEMTRPPEFDELPGEDVTGRHEGNEGRAQGHSRARNIRADDDGRHGVVSSGLSAAIPVDDEGNVYANSFRPSSQDLASLLEVSEAVEPGDVLVIDRDHQGTMRRAFEGSDTGVIGVVAANAGVVLGTHPPASGISGTKSSEMEDFVSGDTEPANSPSPRAAVALAGVVNCKVDAGYGAVWPGDLLVTSPTPGHAMRADAPLPGTMLGKALEPLVEGTGAIRVLVMLR